MSNNIWLNTTVVRSAFVAPTNGYGMGDVCPKAAVNVSSLKRRHADAFQATTPGSGLPWSPPVT
ncbi:MAG: hypothetical protein J7518_08780 [Nocardioidaceae bacterium]|nr:hypothetical protein [Nocardioidaceae bacterium]